MGEDGSISQGNIWQALEWGRAGDSQQLPLMFRAGENIRVGQEKTV